MRANHASEEPIGVPTGQGKPKSEVTRSKTPRRKVGLENPPAKHPSDRVNRKMTFYGRVKFELRTLPSVRSSEFPAIAPSGSSSRFPCNRLTVAAFR